MIVAVKKFDFCNQYSRTLRLCFSDKWGSQNVFSTPRLVDSYAVIELKELSDFDDSRLIAAVFILSLLSGGRPYISRFGLFQTFHTRVYDVLVQVNVGTSGAYNLVNALAERVLPFLAKVDFSMNIQKKKNGTLVGMTIADLSFVRVVETHSVFFRWHDKIRINLGIRHADILETSFLLSAFKF